MGEEKRRREEEGEEEEEEEEEEEKRREEEETKVWNVWNFCIEYLVGIVYNMYGIHVCVRNFSNQFFVYM